MIESEESFDFGKIMVEYQDIIHKFNDWFFMRVKQLYSNEIEELNAIKRQLKELGAMR